MHDLSVGGNLVRRNPWTWLLAAALSTFGLFESMVFGLAPLVKGGFSIKFTVPLGIPDLSSILQGQTSELGAGVGGAGLLLGLLGLLLNAYLSGGYLGGIFRLLRGRAVAPQDFWTDCQGYFVRMVLVEVLTLMSVIMAGSMSFVLGPLVIIAIFFLLSVTFFWQFAVVRDNLSLERAISRGWWLMRSNFREVLGLILLVFLLTGAVSLLANFLAQTFTGYLVDILVWASIGSAFSAAVCSLYDRLTTRDPILH